MLNFTPSGPWDNPVLDDGTYDATVVEIIESSYGDEDNPMLKLVFSLLPEDFLFVTHLYFPNGTSIQAERRIWHFCRCVDLDKRDVLNQPELFADSKLRLEIHTVDPEQSGQEHPYCDVRMFLPAESQGGEARRESVSAIRSDRQ